MSDCTVTTVDLIRHGEPEGGNLIRGAIDSPLTEKGIQQLNTVFASINTDDLSKILSSPRKRCSSTSQLWAKQLNIPYEIKDDFQELHFGDWEGKTVETLIEEGQNKEGSGLEDFWTAPEQHTPHNGETLQDFNQRIANGWHQLINNHKSKHIALVTHGGVIRNIIGNILQIPLNNLSYLEAPHACWSRVCIYHTKGKPDWPQLAFHNRSPKQTSAQ